MRLVLPTDIVAGEVIITTDYSTARVRAVRPSWTVPACGRPARRGLVRGMSPASARRLRRLLSYVRYTEKTSFITLTYREHVDQVKLKRDIHAFTKVLRRRFPKAWGIWKVERQRRGAWHIHMVVFNIDFWHWRELVSAWSRIAGFDAACATNIQQVRSLRHLRVYLSKYIAKATGAEDEHTGRCWGVFNRAHAVFDAVHSYVSVSQLHRIRRVTRRLRYDVVGATFWVYRASYVHMLLEKLFNIEIEHLTLTYSQITSLIF